MFNFSVFTVFVDRGIKLLREGKTYKAIAYLGASVASVVFPEVAVVIASVGAGIGAYVNSTDALANVGEKEETTGGALLDDVAITDIEQGDYSDLEVHDEHIF